MATSRASGAYGRGGRGERHELTSERCRRSTNKCVVDLPATTSATSVGCIRGKAPTGAGAGVVIYPWVSSRQAARYGRAAQPAKNQVGRYDPDHDDGDEEHGPEKEPERMDDPNLLVVAAAPPAARAASSSRAAPSRDAPRVMLFLKVHSRAPFPPWRCLAVLSNCLRYGWRPGRRHRDQDSK